MTSPFEQAWALLKEWMPDPNWTPPEEEAPRGPGPYGTSSKPVYQPVEEDDEHYTTEDRTRDTTWEHPDEQGRQVDVDEAFQEAGPTTDPEQQKLIMQQMMEQEAERARQQDAHNSYWSAQRRQ